MNTKNVKKIYSAPTAHFVGDGFLVHNFIPSQAGLSMEEMNPFILLDYNAPHYFEPSKTPRGVGIHPHRGFETVTFAYKGKVEHQDNSGGGGIIAEGDIQWMTAGSGILHQEFHEKEWSEKGGDFQMVQLWINLPSSSKMTAPQYQSISGKNIPMISLPEEGGNLKVIAGQYKGIDGIARTFTPIHILQLSLYSNKSIRLEFPKHYRTALLVLEGEIIINDDQSVKNNQLVLMSYDGDEFDISSSKDATVLILSALPLDEPIAAYGPFVMNTNEEIIQAVEDFRNGRFDISQKK